MHDPTQLTGIKTENSKKKKKQTENSSCMVVSRNTVRVTSCLSSQELGAFDALYF